MESLFYEKLPKDEVRCGICRHECVIREGKRGICGVRENRGGRLENRVYPLLAAQAADPIEKKPIFHLKPGSYSYSVATVGCNFKCTFCQNASIAQMPADMGGRIEGRPVTPERIVDLALQSGCQSISYTYTEPTVYFELALETARLAREKGLFNIFVTNGFMSEKVLLAGAPVLTAANVDLKAFREKFYQTYCKARLAPVKENIRHLVDMGVLVELTTLLIPGLNDTQDELSEMAAYIAQDLGPETPWHISRFHPCYRLQDRPPTPVSSLMRAFETGKKAGLRYVYTGNVPGLDSENTYCHQCGALLIKRGGYRVEARLVSGGECPECRTQAHGIF